MYSVQPIELQGGLYYHVPLIYFDAPASIHNELLGGKVLAGEAEALNIDYAQLCKGPSGEFVNVGPFRLPPWNSGRQISYDAYTLRADYVDALNECRRKTRSDAIFKVIHGAGSWEEAARLIDRPPSQGGPKPLALAYSPDAKRLKPLERFADWVFTDVPVQVALKKFLGELRQRRAMVLQSASQVLR